MGEWQTENVVDGNVTGELKEQMPVMWVLECDSLPAGRELRVEYTVQLIPEPGSTIEYTQYANTFSTANSTITTKTLAVKRTLEGLTWIDDNADGIRNEDDERLISDVNVSLWKLREGTTFFPSGDNPQLHFIDSRINDLTADQLVRIRVVASIPEGQKPKLYFATSVSDSLSEDKAITLTSVSIAETEYVYDFTENSYWSGTIQKLRWDPVRSTSNSFTLKSITFDLADGTTREFDFTKEGSYSSYLSLYQVSSVRYGGDPADEADYLPYCYPGTSTQISINTGKQISVLATDASAAVAYEQGRYRFTDLPAGTFAVKFEDGTQTISDYIASPANCGSDDTQDSDGIATYSSDRSQLKKTVILGIEMPAVEDMNVALY